MNITIAIASCLIKPEREQYLHKAIKTIRAEFPDAEFLIAFDKKGTDIPGCKTYTHDKGLGHSWNWCLQNASNTLVLQTEDDWSTEAAYLGVAPGELRAKAVVAQHMIDQDALVITRLDNVANPDMIKWYYPGWVVRETNLVGRDILELNKCLPHDIGRGFNQYFYCNRPQFKHKDFHKTVGWYPEGVTVPTVEVVMGRQVIETPGTRVVAYNHNSFVHDGAVQVRQAYLGEEKK